jgi:uncharacterized protein YodC (DUF2158 family)
MIFRVGELVKLKSDGPKMTVEHIGGDMVTCVWFDGSKLSRSTFSEVLLEDAGKPD